MRADPRGSKLLPARTGWNSAEAWIIRVGACITGVGAYLPERRLTNEALSRMVETDDAWIVTRTGIRERRIVAEGQGTVDLATCAAREALNGARIDPTDLDLIIVATSTPDLTFPPTACMVQSNLGAARANAFDLNGVCSGFLNALVTAAQFIEAGSFQHVMVVGAEVLSRIVNYQDRTTCVLFGDGAGAVVLSRGEPGTGMLSFHLQADGDKANLAYCPHTASPTSLLERYDMVDAPYIRQGGRAVFKAAVTKMAESVDTLLEQHGLTADDIRVVIPHQANQRITDALADRLGMPREKVATCIEEYGNTSAATIPLALHKWVHTEGLADGDLVMFCAFAGGLLWGASLFRWNAAALANPMI